jgi:isopentenyl-diphosphate Delta-isomerase
VSGGLDAVRLRHRALPEADLEAVSLRTRLLDRTLQAPLIVSDPGAAVEHGLALVAAAGETVAERPPLLLAGLDALDVVGREGEWRAENAIEVLDADGLAVHLDPLAVALRRGAEAAFAGVLEAIGAAVARVAPRPVLVREAGFGLDFDDVAALRDAGVAAPDVGGRGVTEAGDVAAAFAGWGGPVAEALTDARAAAPGLPLIASGIGDGVEVAKCLALGATAVAVDAPAAVVIEQLRIATWLAGAPSAQELGREHLR